MTEEKKEIILHDNEYAKIKQNHNQKPKRKPNWMNSEIKKHFMTFSIENQSSEGEDKPLPSMVIPTTHKKEYIVNNLILQRQSNTDDPPAKKVKTKTPQEIAEAQLTQINETFDTLVQKYGINRDPIFIIDMTGRLLWMNTSFIEKLKRDQRYLLEKIVPELFEDTTDLLQAHYQVLSDQLHQYEQNVKIRSKNDAKYQTKMTYTLITSLKGQPFGYLITLTILDVVKSKVEISDEYLAPTGLTHKILNERFGQKIAWMFDFNRRCLWMSEDLMILAGKTQEDLLEIGIFAKLLSKNLGNENLMKSFHALFKEMPKTSDFSTEMLLPDGGTQISRMLFERVDTLDGKPFGYIQTNLYAHQKDMPVNDPKLLNDILIKAGFSNEFLDKMYEDSPNSVFLIDFTGICLWANNLYKRLKEDPNIVGKRAVQAFLDMNSSKEFVNRIKRSLIEKPKYVDHVNNIVVAENKWVSVNGFGERIDGIDGKPFGFMITIKPQKSQVSAIETLSKMKLSTQKMTEEKTRYPTMFMDLDYCCLWMNQSWKEVFSQLETDLGTNVMAKRFDSFEDCELLHIAVSSKMDSFEIVTPEHVFNFKRYDWNGITHGYFVHITINVSNAQFTTKSED